MLPKIPWNKGLTKETSVGVARDAGAKVGKARPPHVIDALRAAHLRWIEDGGQPWNKGKSNCYSPETLLLMGADKKGKPSPMKGRHFPAEVAEQNRLAQLENWQNPEYVRRQMVSRSKRNLTQASNPFFGKHHSPATRARLRQASMEYNKQHPDAVARRLSIQSPNKIELKVLAILGSPWAFVGNGKLIINGKCPDFWNGDHKVVEYWGDHWHKNDQPEDRIKHFAEAGYHCFVIRESDLRDTQSLKAALDYFSTTGSYAARSD